MSFSSVDPVSSQGSINDPSSSSSPTVVTFSSPGDDSTLRHLVRSMSVATKNELEIPLLTIADVDPSMDPNISSRGWSATVTAKELGSMSRPDIVRYPPPPLHMTHFSHNHERPIID